MTIEAINELKKYTLGRNNTEKVEISVLQLNRVIKALEQEPCEDAISRGVFEQVRWERDVAIGQLKELGYEFGAKIEPCEDAISRQAVLDLAKKGVLVSNGNYKSVCKAINELPSVNLMPCEDAISRQAALEMAYDVSEIDGEHFTEPCMVVDVEDIQNLPPVNPQKSTEEATKEFKELLESGYYESTYKPKVKSGE